MKRPMHLCLVVLAIMVAGIGSVGQAMAQAARSTDQVMAEYYAKAKAEGSVSVYTVLASDIATKIVQDFNRKYPDIKVELTRFGGNPLVEKFMLEKRAGINNVDVLHFPGLTPILADFIPAGYLDKYVPTTAPLYAESVTIPQYGYPLWVYTSATCYNPRKVTPDEIELLRSYHTWPNPRFKGRVVMTAPIGGTSGTFVVRWWQDKSLGEAWFKKLAELNPHLTNSATNTAQMVASGEYDIGMNCLSDTANRQIVAGGRVEYVFDKDYVLVTPAYSMIANKPPHPNAARLFQEWQLSDDGQTSYQTHSRGRSGRIDWKDKAVEGAWYVEPKNIRPGASSDNYQQIDEDTPKAFQAFSTIFKWGR
ncbi:MAG: extracellular solute-binding protein [Alphaproteobacteria bacterium]